MPKNYGVTTSVVDNLPHSQMIDQSAIAYAHIDGKDLIDQKLVLGEGNGGVVRLFAYEGEDAAIKNNCLKIIGSNKKPYYFLVLKEFKVDANASDEKRKKLEAVIQKEIAISAKLATQSNENCLTYQPVIVNRAGEGEVKALAAKVAAYDFEEKINPDGSLTFTLISTSMEGVERKISKAPITAPITGYQSVFNQDIEILMRKSLKHQYNAMRHLHKNNIVHLDMANRNLLLDRDFKQTFGHKVLLIDYGFAEQLDANGTAFIDSTRNMPLRTLDERRIANAEVSIYSDLYAYRIGLLESLASLLPNSSNVFSKKIVTTWFERSRNVIGDKRVAEDHNNWANNFCKLSTSAGPGLMLKFFASNAEAAARSSTQAMRFFNAYRKYLEPDIQNPIQGENLIERYTNVIAHLNDDDDHYAEQLSKAFYTADPLADEKLLLECTDEHFLQIVAARLDTLLVTPTTENMLVLINSIKLLLEDLPTETFIKTHQKEMALLEKMAEMPLEFDAVKAQFGSLLGNCHLLHDHLQTVSWQRNQQEAEQIHQTCLTTFNKAMTALDELNQHKITKEEIDFDAIAPEIITGQLIRLQNIKAQLPLITMTDFNREEVTKLDQHITQAINTITQQGDLWSKVTVLRDEVVKQKTTEMREAFNKHSSVLRESIIHLSKLRSISSQQTRLDFAKALHHALEIKKLNLTTNINDDITLLQKLAGTSDSATQQIFAAFNVELNQIIAQHSDYLHHDPDTQFKLKMPKTKQLRANSPASNLLDSILHLEQAFGGVQQIEDLLALAKKLKEKNISLSPIASQLHLLSIHLAALQQARTDYININGEINFKTLQALGVLYGKTLPDLTEKQFERFIKLKAIAIPETIKESIKPTEKSSVSNAETQVSEVPTSFEEASAKLQFDETAYIETLEKFIHLFKNDNGTIKTKMEASGTVLDAQAQILLKHYLKPYETILAIHKREHEMHTRDSIIYQTVAFHTVNHQYPASIIQQAINNAPAFKLLLSKHTAFQLETEDNQSELDQLLFLPLSHMHKTADSLGRASAFADETHQQILLRAKTQIEQKAQTITIDYSKQAHRERTATLFAKAAPDVRKQQNQDIKKMQTTLNHHLMKVYAANKQQRKQVERAVQEIVAFGLKQSTDQLAIEKAEKTKDILTGILTKQTPQEIKQYACDQFLDKTVKTHRQAKNVTKHTPLQLLLINLNEAHVDKNNMTRKRIRDEGVPFPAPSIAAVPPFEPVREVVRHHAASNPSPSTPQTPPFEPFREEVPPELSIPEETRPAASEALNTRVNHEAAARRHAATSPAPSSRTEVPAFEPFREEAPPELPVRSQTSAPERSEQDRILDDIDRVLAQLSRSTSELLTKLNTVEKQQKIAIKQQKAQEKGMSDSLFKRFVTLFKSGKKEPQGNATYKKPTRRMTH